MSMASSTEIIFAIWSPPSKSGGIIFHILPLRDAAAAGTCRYQRTKRTIQLYSTTKPALFQVAFYY
jgi:hypothetical protein